VETAPAHPQLPSPNLSIVFIVDVARRIFGVVSVTPLSSHEIVYVSRRRFGKAAGEVPSKPSRRFSSLILSFSSFPRLIDIPAVTRPVPVHTGNCFSQTPFFLVGT